MTNFVFQTSRISKNTKIKVDLYFRLCNDAVHMRLLEVVEESKNSDEIWRTMLFENSD